jgi:heme exporter protein C
MAQSMWRIPRWFYQMGSPKWFYDIGGRLQPWFAVAAAVLLMWGAIWGLAFAPADYQQGNSFRIMYVHVPAAILSQSIFLAMALAGAVGIIWKIKVAFMVARSCIAIGATFTLIALLTGAIWGKPTWGAYWVWDARLTSTLVLLFLYAGVMALNQAITERQVAGKATAILAIVGTINIPIIKYSVEWWNTLHQTSSFTLTAKPSMPADMYLPLLLTVLGSYCVFALVVLVRTRAQILHTQSGATWLIKHRDITGAT